MKLEFSLKTNEEVDLLTHEELLKYIKNLHDNIIQDLGAVYP